MICIWMRHLFNAISKGHCSGPSLVRENLDASKLHCLVEVNDSHDMMMRPLDLLDYALIGDRPTPRTSDLDYFSFTPSIVVLTLVLKDTSAELPIFIEFLSFVCLFPNEYILVGQLF